MTAPSLPALRIAHLYPDLLNVAGDGGNVMSVVSRAAWRGLQTEVVRVGLDDVPDFESFDLIFFQGGQDVEMMVAARDLALKGPALRAAAEAGVVVVAVCAGLQLLGHRYILASGEQIPGVSVLDLETVAGTTRFMQHAACRVTIGGQTNLVVGFENHSGRTTLGPDAEPFGMVVAGAGNNSTDGMEGARQHNVFATYLHGPVLPKNPWLADALAQIAWERRVGGPVEFAPLDDSVEARNHDKALSLAVANAGEATVLEPAQLARGLNE